MSFTIDHLNISVKNLKKSVDFYCKLFDLEVAEKGTSDGVPYKIIGRSGQFFLCLYEHPDDLNQGRVNHFGINTPTFDNFLHKLTSLNIPLLPYGVIDWGQSKSAYIADPDGNEIEISSSFGGGL